MVGPGIAKNWRKLGYEKLHCNECNRVYYKYIRVTKSCCICNSFFEARTIHQVTCGMPYCKKKHNALQQKARRAGVYKKPRLAKDITGRII